MITRQGVRFEFRLRACIIRQNRLELLAIYRLRKTIWLFICVTHMTAINGAAVHLCETDNQKYDMVSPAIV